MRTWVAVAFVALLTLGAVGGAVWLLTAGPGGLTREGQAEATAEAYSEAWEQQDWAALGGLVLGSPEGIGGAHEQVIEDLEITALRVSAGGVSVDRGLAEAELSVTATLAGLGDWTYPTRLRMLRESGEWRVDWSPATIHPELDEDHAFDRRVVEPERAPVLAHDETPITDAGTVHLVGIHPARMDDPEEVIEAFDEHTSADPEEVRRLLDRGDLRDDWFYPVVTLHEDRFATVESDLRPVAGIVFRTAPARVTPVEGFARHIVGVTGEITAELLEELGDTYQPGDEVGLFGLERVFEEQLTGAPSAEIVLIDASDRGDDRDDEAAPEPVEVVHRFAGDEPEPVHTTLDIAIQTAVEEALEGIDDPTAIVVLDVASGAIRASASRPLGEYDRALGGQYPPGSAAKIVTAAALLATMTPEDEVDCPEEVTVGGLRIGNVGDLALGATDLRAAFADSCNTTFAELGADLGGDRLAAAAETFGFDATYTLPLPVHGGRFPVPEDRAEAAAAAIGQGRVQATPLHMASVAAAVADGAWRPPHLLVDDAPSTANRLDSAVVSDLTAMMRLAVTEGSGTAADVAGPPVHGKTGSAEFGDREEDGELPTHAWFVGFREGLAFSVLVEGGGSGGEVAAPVAGRLLTALDAGAEPDER